MLYLPPKYAHNGVALTDCMTWSIGFRSPSAQEMASEFLNYLQDSLCLDGLYADPDLGYSKQPGKIPPLMVDRLKDMIRTIRWTDHDMEDFIGRYLSDPKPNVFFEPPPRPVSFFRFHNQACKRGLVLNGRSRLLYLGGVFFMNGERLEVERGIQAKLRPLADSRRLPPGEFDDVFSSLLYEWYKTGFLAPAS
jgi:50S ribosomal protein L16 3-hydroxylase